MTGAFDAFACCGAPWRYWWLVVPLLMAAMGIGVTALLIRGGPGDSRSDVVAGLITTAVLLAGYYIALLILS